MIIKLRSYLASLEEAERAKPESIRRDVPSLAGLADDVGISRQQLHRIASSNIESLRLAVAGDIIKAMRRRGFPMEVNDLLGFIDE